MSRSAAAALVLALACGCSACSRSPAGPDETLLDIGRWSGDGACLSVTDAGCELIVGCGRGRFPRPTVRADGTFDVDGTYRIEAGPVSIEPAPPAHFAGSVSGIGLVLTVVPMSLPKASYGFVRSESRPCAILCLSAGTTSASANVAGGAAPHSSRGIRHLVSRVYVFRTEIRRSSMRATAPGRRSGGRAASGT